MGHSKGEKFRTAFETYTVAKQIGTGGSGVVYEAIDSEGALFAIKVLDSARTSSRKLRRFKNEINFCTKNTHKNVIQVHGTGVTDSGESFYVMARFAGTLRDLLSKGIATKSALPYFGQILDGLEAAHLLNVWHRDVKPENILHSAADDRLVVADFGIAHFEEDELLTAVETKNDERLANFLYSAPEQRARGQKVDSRADVYALGLILNEMFTRRVPQGTSFMSVSDAAPDFAYLDGLVDAMLRQDPASRPSVPEVKRQLIDRGNEFLSVQRLNALKSEIIPETEVDDPIVRNPITVISADYSEGHLIFKLSAAPPSNWIAAFARPAASYSSYPGSGPAAFNFRGNQMSVPLAQGMSAKRVAEYTDSYVRLANSQYAENLRTEVYRNLRVQQEQRQRQIAEEERRQRILRELNS